MVSTFNRTLCMKISKMVLKSKPSSTFINLSVLPFYVLLVLICTRSSYGNGNITSITRLPNQDDSFEVVSTQERICPSNICSKYKAQEKILGVADGCVCQCPSPRSTFYSKTNACVESKDINDENGCSIEFKDNTLGILPVLDIMGAPGSLRLENKMQGDCSKAKTSWFYLKNGTWYQGTNGMISVILKQHWTKPDKWFLKWHSGLQSNYSGIIIKVIVTCDSILDQDTGCVIFKSQGTFQVKQSNIIPTTIPQTSTTVTPKPPTQTTVKTDTSTEYKPTQATTSPTEKQVKSTSGQTTTASLNKSPRKEASSSDKTLWIAFAAGGITILLVMIGSLIFFLLLCRQRKKHASRTGQSSSRRGNANDPLHDYEYVVYPVLTEGHQSSLPRSIADNAMYERGPDNELIIRTPGISMESLATNSINHKRDGNLGNKRSSSAYYPRDIPSLNHITNTSNTIGNSSHVYAQLQRKKDNDDVDSSGIYQPLIRSRPVTPDFNDNRTDESQNIPLEPITTPNTSTVPEYMVLEPDITDEHDANA